MIIAVSNRLAARLTSPADVPAINFNALSSIFIFKSSVICFRYFIISVSDIGLNSNIWHLDNKAL